MLRARRSGILLHPTSLPGPHGIGDLGPGAYHFVDWLSGAGQSLWQVLPLTPIGPGNSPYASISAFAGSPLLVAFEPLVAAGWLDAPTPADTAGFDPRAVDFASVVPWRMAQLRKAAGGFEQHASASERRALDDWASREAGWLDDYCLFMALESHFNSVGGSWRDWTAWDPALARREPATLAAARQAHAAEIGFWRFVQWCFDRQWSALRAYAAERGVRMVGDLPIFIAHHSADCWARPDLYWLDERLQPTVIAGVPPDYFSATGQRWGNPLYRWEAFERDDYRWWAARLRRQLALADIVRVDHFRGFAGYWEIPADSPTAIKGRWVEGPGVKLFRALQAQLGELPIIAEDLGVITDDVVALRDALGFPGMRILQFAFGGGADHAYLPHNYPVNAVAYTGTHDNDTTRGWWDSATAQEREHAHRYLDCEDQGIHWSMMRAVSASVARTAIFPLQDVLGLGTRHRLNTPGSVDCWTWRFVWDQVGQSSGARLRDISACFGRIPVGHPALDSGAHR